MNELLDIYIIWAISFGEEEKEKRKSTHLYTHTQKKGEKKPSKSMYLFN